MMISVIIPTYNRASMIERTIDSVLAQTYPDIQLIIIDDGSTDNTQAVIQKYLNQTDLNIEYYYKNNGGCSTARNEGLKYAKGDYIAFLDSDDCWLPLALETLFKTLENSQASFVYSPSIEIDKTNIRRSLKYPCATDRPQDFAIEHFLTSNCRHGGILYHHSIFEKIPGFREDLRYHEDSDFLQKVAIEFSAVYCPYPGLEYHHHEGNKSSDRVAIYSAMLISSKDILDNHPNFYRQLGNKADKYIKNTYIEQIKALVNIGNFTEAKIIEKILNPHLNIALKLSLILNSKLPLLIQYLLCKIPVKALNKLTYLIQGNKV